MKKFLMKTSSVFCILIVMLFASSMPLVSQGTSETTGTQKVSLRVATQTPTDRNNSVLLDILNQFEKDYPNVKIELEECPGNDLIQKINTDIMGDNTPDLFTYWRPEAKWSVDKYIKKGSIADLTSLVKTDPFFNNLFPDYAWRTATVDGKIYCIPRQSFYVEFMVNKTLFDKYNIALPTDWASLVNACAQLQKNGIIPWAVDTKEGLDDSSRIFNAIINRVVGNAKGLELLQGKQSFQQPDIVRALGYFKQVVSGYAPEDAAILDFNQAITKYYNTGKAGMLLGNAGQIDINLTADIMKNSVALDFPLTPVSVIDKPSMEQDITNLVYLSSKAYNDKNKQQYVVELLKRIVSKDTAKQLAEREKVMVPHLGIEIDPATVSDLQRSAAKLAANSAGDKWLLSYAKPGPVNDFRIAINEFWTGKYSPEEFAKVLDGALYGK